MARVQEIEIAAETAVNEIYSLVARLSTDVASRVIKRELTAAQVEIVGRGLQQVASNRARLFDDLP